MDSRAIFKAVDLDMRQYSKLRMFLHAESLPGNELLPGSGPKMNLIKEWLHLFV